MSRDWTAVSRCCMQVREARSSDDEAEMKLGVHAYEDAIDKYVTARYSRIARVRGILLFPGKELLRAGV